MRFEASANSPSLATRAGNNSDEINKCEAIFINIAEWGADKHHFTDIDISLNTIEEEQGPESSPTFVKDYLVNLDKKASLSPEVHSRSLMPLLVSNKLIKARKRFDAMDPEWRTTYFVTTDGLPVSIQGTQGHPQTMLVAKKIRRESNELEIFRLIHLLQPQSEHVITLLDSFHEQSSSWAILPKIRNNVEDWLWYDRKPFLPHRSPVCWGLVKGLAYLHKYHIAHRDIKPENLLVDDKFCLKIIDFDVAVQVRDDDEEVDDQCGTEGWVAPEIEPNAAANAGAP
ncbi:hypothetical protein EYR40_002306 [Pleurotus pulmonarius]|nr:hypothetical protein EYR36_002203 [Pleurotus pulmonarius]KAF4583813.1 hypothetical protein EYR40_002306 [Pleurotus pulmonarius]